MAEPLPLAFTRQPDGSVTVDRWVPEILVSHELLAHAEPGFLARHENTLRFHVANGDAIYRIADEGRGQEFLRAELLESRIVALRPAPEIAPPAEATASAAPKPAIEEESAPAVAVPATPRPSPKPRSKSESPKPPRKKGRK